MIQKLKTLLLSGMTTFIAFCLIKYPDQSLEASIRGLNMWWEVVFPSLLPFFITAELLIGFGFVKFIGVLFEPIMRPLFNVPGSGSFAWAMGMASGYPTGAKISARLREEGQLTQIEAERLVSFTNASSPLFIFGAVSVGFFYDVKLGIVLASSHYIANALVGICMRFYGRRAEMKSAKSKKYKTSILRAFREMHRTRLNDPRPFGKIVGDAVLNSIQTLVMVGGFIILFSVFTKLLYIAGISPIIAIFFQHLLQILMIPAELALPLLSGLFEITLGASQISQENSANLLEKIIVVSFILGFNGLSVQAQVASIIAPTDIRFAPYFFARILHGIFAAILTALFYTPLYLNRTSFDFKGVPVSNDMHEESWLTALHRLAEIGPVITLIAIASALFIILSRMQKT
ncbi:sporulation integral membrane protein YlbJ [Lentibacillus amyloliquefaciens]|uniref:Sporulation integral membrane protein YlbJ n=1 Tax=Lentibacillus amyloliquefaciens TaxID=1472767 RepID=A0A0U4G408_9BACI|nr:sporulation integral membrane protein YlbJ [Lentibacillus amyloliquefaciens]ALX47370.1 sporulation integral membrane protein YlbJ [Lentibacillus amyloliquefaciens]